MGKLVVDPRSLKVEVLGMGICGSKREGVSKESGNAYKMIELELLGGSLSFFVDDDVYGMVDEGTVYRIQAEVANRGKGLALVRPRFEAVEG